MAEMMYASDNVHAPREDTDASVEEVLRYK